MPKRLILFIDAQNMYWGARDAFFKGTDSHVLGQFDPIKLGHLIAGRKPHGDEHEDRELKEVRIYTGSPDSTKAPQTYGAHRRQAATWQKSGVTVTARTLRYPRRWPTEKAEEKGIDVALAIDFVVMAVEDEYDIGVIASTDTDLRPALEYVIQRPGVCAEAAAWDGAIKKELSVPGQHLWCHRLARPDYDSVVDYTDYNLKP